MTLFEAVKLASSQSAAPTAPKLSRFGPEYYSFGASRSRACATTARDRGTVPLAGESCYLAGPATTRSALRSELPRGVAASAAVVLKVPQGLVVVQAANQSGIGIGAAAARFFVLRDRVAVSGAQLTDPRVSSEAGQPVVQFGFTARGAKAFQSSTAAISKRGETVSSGTGNAPLFQHFAVTFDGALLTVPQIDFVKYPDGVVETGGRNGAEIFASSAQQARRVVNALRLGPLPLALQLVGKGR
jgi:preprotein translocase subunit SecD